MMPCTAQPAAYTYTPRRQLSIVCIVIHNNSQQEVKSLQSAVHIAACCGSRFGVAAMSRLKSASQS